MDIIINEGNNIVLVVRGWLDKEKAEIAMACMKYLPFEQGILNIFGEKNKPRLDYAIGDANVGYHSYSKSQVPVHSWNIDPFKIENNDNSYCARMACYLLRQRMLKESGVYFNSFLINYYRDGNDYISAHSDSEVKSSNNCVITVTLNENNLEARTFVMINIETKEKTKVKLYHGDAVLMFGDTQKNYKHEIPKEKKITSARYAITGRFLELHRPDITNIFQ
jgi:alkylated DNA repair dioxygenase AlkB